MMKSKESTITEIRQGFLLRLPFADNGVLSGKRTYLLIGEEENYIKLLNVSSTKGKEHKLLYDSNEEIINYNPPFKVKSFLKLDSLYLVEKCTELNDCVLARGKQLDENEFRRLLNLFEEYKRSNSVLVSKTSANELRKYLLL